jgi:haloalkane dehalogenase
MPTARPAWVDDRLLPYASRFLEVDGHTIHHLDEGEGPTLLLVHGNPTWSFLYRDLIRSLRPDFRCVAPDLPGFGLSTAAPGYRHLPADHAAVLGRFVDALDLDGFTVVGHDWGGPIGLHVAARRVDRLRALVLGNTWAWPVDSDPHFVRFSRALGGWAGGVAIRQANAFVNLLVPFGHARRRLTKRELDHYRLALDTPRRREASHVFPREIVGSSPFLRDVARGLATVEDVPTLFVWGDRDRAFRLRELERFERILPYHTTRVLHGAGHYIQEDAPDEIAAAIRGWWPPTRT